MKRGGRIRARSTKTARRDREYTADAREFLAENPECQAGPVLLPSAGCTGGSEQVHHMAGRVGALMLDRRYWRALCARCHGWVTDHPAEARAAGLSLHRNQVGLDDGGE